MCNEYAHLDQLSIRCKGNIYDCDFVAEDVTVCPVNIKWLKEKGGEKIHTMTIRRVELQLCHCC